MNERLKELAVQAGLALTPNTNPISWFGLATDLERFADLVRQDEREANAKLLDDFAKTSMVPIKDTWRMGVMAAANSMRDKK